MSPESGTALPNPLVDSPQLQQNFDALSRRFAEIDLTLAELTVGTPPSGPAGGSLDGTYPNPGLAASVAGAGLAESSDVLSVNVDASSIEINADTLRVKAGGITNAMLAGSIAYSKLTLTGSIVTGDLAFDVATQAELDAHISDTSAAHAASAVSFSPAGSIAATDVQAAIVEAASEASPSFPLLAPDGSLAAPSYSFSSDTSAGMFWHDIGGLDTLQLTGDYVKCVAAAGDVSLNSDTARVFINAGTSIRLDADTSLFIDGDTSVDINSGGSVVLKNGGSTSLTLSSSSGAFAVPITCNHADGLVLSANGGKDTLALSNTTADVGLTIGADTNLYRSAANTLKTDDSLIVAGTASNVPKFEAVTGYKIIAGAVNSAGALSIGAGFTSAKDATGDYALTWSDDFSSTPLVMASCGSTASKTIAANPTTTGCDIRTFSADAATDTAFNFIALGPI